MKTEYQEVAEVGEIKDELYEMQNIILDNYKINPQKCNKLLKELCEINKELDELEKEYEQLLKQL